MGMEHWWNDTDRGQLKYWETNCHSDTLSTTNLAWTELESITRLRGEVLVTNSPTHDTAQYI